ncbi:MAG TPA: hypothetical protein VFW86_02450, partial [Candidatus Limnocylindrales bacterium]|nr:hypothetical protein [Candidatus Limnocylindrales bacterium]
LMDAPGMSDLVNRKMTERLARTSISALPKIGGLDQADLRALRQAPSTEGAVPPAPTGPPALEPPAPAASEA